MTLQGTVHAELRQGYGAGRTTELYSLWYGRDQARSLTGKVPVILCHGYNADATQWYDPTLGIVQLSNGLAKAGLGCFGADLDGLSTWGRANYVDSIEDIIVHANSSFGTRTDAVALVALSMGGTALNWVRQNAGRLVAFAGLLPCCALDALHDRDPGGFGALIETAYGGATPYNNALAANPSCDPSAATSITVFQTVASKIKMWYSGNDTTILPADVTTFGTAVGCEVVNVGNVGHTLNWNVQPVVDWLAPKVWWPSN